MIRPASPRLFLHLRTRAELRPDARPEGADSPLGRFCADTVPVWSSRQDGLLLDMRGTGRLYGPGLSGSVDLCRRAADIGPVRAAGLAPTALAAQLASLLADRTAPRGILSVPPGSLARFLSVFPVRLLRHGFPGTAELARLGVRTLGDLQVVPEALVQVVCGQPGLDLARAARGLADPLSGDGDHRAGERELVVGARWRRPLTGPDRIRALQSAFARRAVVCCRGDGAGRAPWILRAQWPDGRTRHSRHATWSGGGWSDWQDLMAALWRGLGAGRTGLTRLELWAATGREGGPRQASLFPADGLDRALAEVVARTGAADACGLRPASQVVLASLHLRWYGPAETDAMDPKPGTGRIVDAHRSGR